MSHYASSSGIYWFTRSAIDISIRISRARQVDVIREIPIGSAPAEKGRKWEEVCPEHFRLGGL